MKVGLRYLEASAGSHRAWSALAEEGSHNAQALTAVASSKVAFGIEELRELGSIFRRCEVRRL